MDNHFDLDALLAEAAKARVTPSPELTAQILQDADLAQPRPQPPVRTKASNVTHDGVPGWWIALTDVLGGGRALAGLSLAGMTGLYLGIAQPDLVASLTGALSTQGTTLEQLDLLPATDTLWTEN